jgi:hypothetical protein
LSVAPAKVALATLSLTVRSICKLLATRARRKAMSEYPQQHVLGCTIPGQSSLKTVHVNVRRPNAIPKHQVLTGVDPTPYAAAVRIPF